MPLDEDILRQLKESDWERLTPRLVKYAIFKVRRLEWRTGAFLPKGLLPEDLALEAIRKTFEGVRLWDTLKKPALLEHLKSVVDSDVHALVSSAEHRLTNYSTEIMETLDAGGGLSAVAYAVTAEDALIARETTGAREQQLNRLLQDLYLACVDDEEELLVLMAYQEASKKHDRVKAALVAKYAGLDEKVARNAMRRLARKVDRRRFDG